MDVCESPWSQKKGLQWSGVKVGPCKALQRSRKHQKTQYMLVRSLSVLQGYIHYLRLWKATPGVIGMRGRTESQWGHGSTFGRVAKLKHCWRSWGGGGGLRFGCKVDIWLRPMTAKAQFLHRFTTNTSLKFLWLPSRYTQRETICQWGRDYLPLQHKSTCFLINSRLLANLRLSVLFEFVENIWMWVTSVVLGKLDFSDGIEFLVKIALSVCSHFFLSLSLKQKVKCSFDMADLKSPLQDHG